MDAIASQITNLTIVYSTVYSPVTRKMFPFDDVIMDEIKHSTTW